jgi:hypothetical protein
VLEGRCLQTPGGDEDLDRVDRVAGRLDRLHRSSGIDGS